MLSPAELYPLVHTWLKALEVSAHASAVAALAHLVTALLLGQSLRPTALMRALWSPSPVPARQRYKRVARALDRPWLAPAWLTPRLVRAALALVAPEPEGSPLAGLTLVVLDSLRCGRWELFTVSVAWHGRVLPVAWAVLPAPWPPGRFTPTVKALVRSVTAAWPPVAERPAHLVADRAFPSYGLFAVLRAARWGWTVRLQARHWITRQGQSQAEYARTLVATARPGWWHAIPGAYGSGGKQVSGTLVVGRGLVVLPWHQRDAGSLRHRQRRLGQRHQHAASKNQSRTAELDQWVILFTTLPGVRPARCAYRRRWPTEGTYRDAQSGWDGHHGWEFDRLAERAPTAAAVERLAGLWALGTLLQSWIGHQATQPSAPPLVRGIVRQWSTTGRLSLCARGQLALTEPSGQLRPWLGAILAEGAQRLAAAPPRPAGPRRPRQPARRAARVRPYPPAVAA